jgi:hypothetical protein
MRKTISKLEMLKMFYVYKSRATAQLINSPDQLNPEQLTAPGCYGQSRPPHPGADCGDDPKIWI